MTSIGRYAFSGCSSLIEIENGVSYVDKWAIGFDNTIAVVELRWDTVGIADYAFYDASKLRSIAIPDSVTSIGDSAFYYCSSLTSVTLGDSVTSIGDYAFYGCSSLTSIEIPDSVTSIYEEAFAYCSSLTSIEIPDSVTSIGDCAFYNCSSLTSIDYGGTISQWENIEKEYGWDGNNGDRIEVKCTDGTLYVGGYGWQ